MKLSPPKKTNPPSTEDVDAKVERDFDLNEKPYDSSSSDDKPVSVELLGEEEDVNDSDEPAPVPVENVVPQTVNTGRQDPLLWQIWEQEDNEWIVEHMTEDIDLDQQNNVIDETCEPSRDLTMPLLRYQKEFLAWGLKQEQSVGGGILADEMGMGKTIQAIALVLAKREIDRLHNGNALGCTLVLCPVVAVSQWRNEITRFTTPGSTKVLVYHGTKREKDAKEFMNYDFVLTTYSTVESEYRRNIMPPKEQCKFCQKLYYPKKLNTHMRYHCGPEKHKQKRKKTVEEDPVGREESLLHSIKWNRIILDEAHYIKERRSRTTKAVLSLDATFRWALSGTPLQNRVGEFYSLIQFLRIRPYSYYLCQDCDCRGFDYILSQTCSACGHRSVRHFCWWYKNVANPISLHGGSTDAKRAMILLKYKILKEILLRRTKLGRTADVALPPRIISIRRDALDRKEADYYESIYKHSQAELNTCIQAGTFMTNSAHIFDLLTRLRQAVNHPYLVVYSSSRGNNANLPDLKKNEQECGVCHDSAEDHIVTSCAHVFCKSCLIGYSTSLEKVTCPTCSKPVTLDWTTKTDTDHQESQTKIKGFSASSILHRIKLDEFQTSTKIEALREEIRLMVERDGSAKAIVFSQYTSFLDLINYALGKSGVSCVQLVGSMTMAARDSAINKFKDDPDCRVFLMSLKAGGIALNLTVASHVFMMDPWWNPAVERQAQDRIHRIGQYKPIRIVRFIIENTVEERILSLQQKKELVFEGTVGGCKEAIGKLTSQDMRFLFTH